MPNKAKTNNNPYGPITSTQRYAAKQAYQLFLMRGITKSTCCGFSCIYFRSSVLKGAKPVIILCKGATIVQHVPVAKSWAELI